MSGSSLLPCSAAGYVSLLAPAGSGVGGTAWCWLMPRQIQGMAQRRGPSTACSTLPRVALQTLRGGRTAFDLKPCSCKPFFQRTSHQLAPVHRLVCRLGSAQACSMPARASCAHLTLHCDRWLVCGRAGGFEESVTSTGHMSEACWVSNEVAQAAASRRGGGGGGGSRRARPAAAAALLRTVIDPLAEVDHHGGLC